MHTSLSRRLMLTAGLALAVQFTCLPLAHADELDDIIKSGVLKVGIFEDFPPFSSAGTV
jgi:polar amino acid transport system substrate-binding protein